MVFQYWIVMHWLVPTEFFLINKVIAALEVKSLYVVTYTYTSEGIALILTYWQRISIFLNYIEVQLQS